MHIITGWLACCLLLLGATSGCVTVSDDDRYGQADRLTLAKEEYERKKEYCESLGGAMSLRARPLEPPGYTEYRSATCVRR